MNLRFFALLAALISASVATAMTNSNGARVPAPMYLCQSQAGEQIDMAFNSPKDVHTMNLRTEKWTGSLQLDPAVPTNAGFTGYTGAIGPVCDPGQPCPHWVRRSQALVEDKLIAGSIVGRMILDQVPFDCELLMGI